MRSVNEWYTSLLVDIFCPVFVSNTFNASVSGVMLKLYFLQSFFNIIAAGSMTEQWYLCCARVSMGKKNKTKKNKKYKIKKASERGRERHDTAQHDTTQHNMQPEEEKRSKNTHGAVMDKNLPVT